MKKYKITKHAAARQCQRGITSSMVDYVFEHGTNEDDKLVLGRKEALQRLAKIKEEERVLMKILDKGGVVIVADGENVITTYNRGSYSRRAKRAH